jgi:hypothetical protein
MKSPVQQLELAGLPAATFGPGASWSLPDELELLGDLLCWRGMSRPGLTGPRTVRAGSDLLSRFSLLADGTDSRILKFARKYGPLFLCHPHGRPLPPRRTQFGHGHEEPECAPRGGLLTPFAEPLVRWRELSAQSRAVIDVTVTLRAGQRLTPPQLQPLVSCLPGGADAWDFNDRRTTAVEARQMVAYVVNEWMSWAGSELRISWAGVSPEVTYGAPALFGALAVELALSLSTVRSVAFCDNCHRAYHPKRQPHPGERKYCPDDDCRIRAARRDQARARRARAAAGDT